MFRTVARCAEADGRRVPLGTWDSIGYTGPVPASEEDQESQGRGKRGSAVGIQRSVKSDGKRSVQQQRGLGSILRQTVLGSAVSFKEQSGGGAVLRAGAASHGR